MMAQKSLNGAARYLEIDEAQNLVGVYIQSGEGDGSRIDVNVSRMSRLVFSEYS
jgi:hypothetical protein